MVTDTAGQSTDAYPQTQHMSHLIGVKSLSYSWDPSVNTYRLHGVCELLQNHHGEILQGVPWHLCDPRHGVHDCQ